MSGRGKDALIWMLRRWVIAPATLLLILVIATTLPVWVIVAAAISPIFPGRWRVLRLLWILLLYLAAEGVMLVVLFAFWVASGFGWKLRTPYWQGLHYDVVQIVMWVFFVEAGRVLNLQIVREGPTPDAYPGTPIVVGCRHAGPGDSFVLIHALMNSYGREPRIVLKDTLAWDPAIGVLLNRLPARFIKPNPAEGASLEDEIAELARGLDENDAFVIFPEGGNFTPQRRDRAIAKLRSLGLEKMADRAEEMTFVLAPRPGGLLAALEAAPETDVVLVAHTGLDHLLTVGDIWRELPMDKRIIMRWWRVPRDEIPADRDAQIDWLFEWWERIDDWITEHRPEPLPPLRTRRERRARAGY